MSIFEILEISCKYADHIPNNLTSLTLFEKFPYKVIFWFRCHIFQFYHWLYSIDILYCMHSMTASSYSETSLLSFLDSLVLNLIRDWNDS